MLGDVDKKRFRDKGVQTKMYKLRRTYNDVCRCAYKNGHKDVYKQRSTTMHQDVERCAKR